MMENRGALQGAQNNQPLDEDQRLKVLSPGMLVIKRFIRNRLAVIGLIIIVVMMLFSFVGGVLMPYSQSEVFYEDKVISQEFAGVTENNAFLYNAKDGTTLPTAAQPEFIRAVSEGKNHFSLNSAEYFIEPLGPDFYSISVTAPVGSALVVGKRVSFNPAEGQAPSDELIQAFSDAVAAKQPSFEFDGANYFIAQAGKTYTLSTGNVIATASKMIFDMADPGVTPSFEFKLKAELALDQGRTSFSADGVTYTLARAEDEGNALIYVGDALYAGISHFIVKPTASDLFLTMNFKAAVRHAVAEGLQFFEYAEAGELSVRYELVRQNTQYLIRADMPTKLLRKYNEPSREHALGTDDHGMDIMARLMYGGRISLTVGFVVVVLETLIGVIVGGAAGYFGGWIDNMLMRLVDIFNCLPTMPLIIIIGSIMDQLRVDPTMRMYLLMVVLSVLGWPYPARIVRGQILSLREQEFMIATEATGLSVMRRIFHHLVPNVIPQLIVVATMGLGQTILTESTLSFLGLGIKFPYASWGNIINAVNNIYVMTNYWFAWIPAGFLILITVLGFNFIGDGLRDAYDPKMKR